MLLRDALLEPATQASHGAEIEHAYAAIDSLLMQHVPFLDSAAEREQVARLRGEIADFRVVSNEVLATDSSRWPAAARDRCAASCSSVSRRCVSRTMCRRSIAPRSSISSAT